MSSISSPRWRWVCSSAARSARRSSSHAFSAASRSAVAARHSASAADCVSASARSSFSSADSASPSSAISRAQAPSRSSSSRIWRSFASMRVLPPSMLPLTPTRRAWTESSSSSMARKRSCSAFPSCSSAAIVFVASCSSRRAASRSTRIASIAASRSASRFPAQRRSIAFSRSPASRARRARAAWRSTETSCLRTSLMMSLNRTRFSSVESSLRSASRFFSLYLVIPAASSKMKRRSSGLELSTMSIFPCSMME